MDGNYDEAEIEKSCKKKDLSKDLLSIHLRYRSDKPGKNLWNEWMLCPQVQRKIYVTTKRRILNL